MSGGLRSILSKDKRVKFKLKADKKKIWNQSIFMPICHKPASTHLHTSNNMMIENSAYTLLIYFHLPQQMLHDHGVKIENL